jgi:hypothetical protein
MFQSLVTKCVYAVVLCGGLLSTVLVAEAEAVTIKGSALKVSPEVIQYEIAQRWDGKAPLAVSTMQGGSNVLLPLK